MQDPKRASTPAKPLNDARTVLAALDESLGNLEHTLETLDEEERRRERERPAPPRRLRG